MFRKQVRLCLYLVREGLRRGYLPRKRLEPSFYFGSPPGKWLESTYAGITGVAVIPNRTFFLECLS